MGVWKTSTIVLITAVLVVKVPQWFKDKAPITGEVSFVAQGWEKVEDAFKDLRDSGEEEGGSFAVYHQGELVFEGHAGYADDEARVPYESDTLVIIFSASKMLGSLCVALLADRGFLDYGKPVAHYWPDFAQNGKDKITVDQLLSHQAGLSHLDDAWEILDPETDPEGFGKKLASQKPHWTPGTAQGYHGVTIGLYMDQLVRHIDPKHRSISQFFEDEIRQKFDLDIYLGLPLGLNHRCARLYAADMSKMSNLKRLLEPAMLKLFFNMWYDQNSLQGKMTSSPPEINRMEWLNNPRKRAASNPAMSGYATAVSLAKLMDILYSGKLISASTLQKLTEVISSKIDLIVGRNATFSRGPYMRPSPSGNMMIGHPGAGGNMIFMDLDRKLGFGYTTNHMSISLNDDPRYLKLESAVYDAYNDLQKNKKI